MSSLSNKYINPIWANIPPKSNVPAILQPIEKPATWFDLQNKLTSFYICPENTEIPKRRRNISSKWVKLEKKTGQSNNPYVL